MLLMRMTPNTAALLAMVDTPDSKETCLLGDGPDDSEIAGGPLYQVVAPEAQQGKVHRESSRSR
jgi:hypothetical protein